MIDKGLKTGFIASTKRALSGKITSSLIAVAIGTDGIKLIIKYYTDKIPDENDIEIFGDISTEILADFYYDDLEETHEYTVKSFIELEASNDNMVFVPIQ